jgi:hypothetical protein
MWCELGRMSVAFDASLFLSSRDDDTNILNYIPHKEKLNISGNLMI